MQFLQFCQLGSFWKTLIAGLASKGTCASADNPKKCTDTVQNHLKNTIRTLWQEEIMPEQTKQLKDHFDKELAKLTNTISEIKAPLQVRIRVDT